MSTPNISEEFLRIEYESKLLGLNFGPPVEYVFNPLEYAAEPHEEYVRKFCNGPKKILFLGMNPGKWGMGQTGIPFGDVTMTRDWLKIKNANVKTGKFDAYKKRCTRFSVTGFDCKFPEESGTRFWSLIQEKFNTPEEFFMDCFVYNYCPLLFLNKAENNLTPSKLTQKASDKKKLQEYCDESLSKIIKLLDIKTVIGIGRYAENRAKVVTKKKDAGLENVTVKYLIHPSQLARMKKDKWIEEALKIYRSSI